MYFGLECLLNTEMHVGTIRHIADLKVILLRKLFSI